MYCLLGGAQPVIPPNILTWGPQVNMYHARRLHPTLFIGVLHNSLGSPGYSLHTGMGGAQPQTDDRLSQ